MSVADLKQELANSLSSRRSGSSLSSSSGSNAVWIKPVVIGGGVLGVLVSVYLMGRSAAPQAVDVAVQDTPQQSMALEFLARNQAISEKILAGQQELNSQIVQSQAELQKNAKRDIVICVASNKCPNPDNGGGNIVIQPGATTGPAAPRTPAAPAQPSQPERPVQTVDYSAPTGDAQHYDEWQAHYADMQARFPEMFSQQWSQCSADWQQTATPQINCAALAVYLDRVYGGRTPN